MAHVWLLARKKWPLLAISLKFSQPGSFSHNSDPVGTYTFKSAGKGDAQATELGTYKLEK